MKKNIISGLLLIVAIMSTYILKYNKGHAMYSKGDRVQLTESCVEGHCFYDKCQKLTYIQSLVLNRYLSNKPVEVAWILVEKCPWYQYPDLGINTTQAVITLEMKEFEKYYE